MGSSLGVFLISFMASSIASYYAAATCAGGIGASSCMTSATAASSSPLTLPDFDSTWPSGMSPLDLLPSFILVTMYGHSLQLFIGVGSDDADADAGSADLAEHCLFLDSFDSWTIRGQSCQGPSYAAVRY